MTSKLFDTFSWHKKLYYLYTMIKYNKLIAQLLWIFIKKYTTSRQIIIIQYLKKEV